MAKKSSNKSKSSLKPILKRYQFAGFNSATNQIATPYYISRDFADRARQDENYFYNQAQNFGRYSATSNEEARLREQKRLQELEDSIRAQKTASAQQEKEFATSSGTKLIEIAAKERAAKIAAEAAAKEAAAAAAKDAVQQTGSTAVAQAKPTLLSSQAVRGSGIESARLANDLIAQEGAETVAKEAVKTAVPKTGLAKIAGANVSNLAAAGIGLGLTGAGMLIENKASDKDYTTFTEKEKKGNLWGSAIKGAGQGASWGATAGTILPGPGNVIGMAAGALVGGTVGLIKGRKENKESERIAEEYAKEQALINENEAKRKRLLASQSDLLARQYNTAFINSRLMGTQTGFGYNTSTNMNMQPTSSFYAETGGLRVPGGKVVPIEGSDAVKFVGRKHSEGGIKLDPQTEVEGGETMDQVVMAKSGGKGNMNDYFFSAYLKLGGKSFAKRHEELIKQGASQKEIQDLAKKQEAVAYKYGEKDRGPEQIAAYGGIHKYQTAGSKPVAGPTGKPVYKPLDAMTEEEQNAYFDSPYQEGDNQRAVAPNLPWVKDSGEKTFAGNAKATYDFGTKPAATNNSRRPGPDSTAAEQVDSKGARTPQQSADAQSNRSAKTGTTIRDQNRANAAAPKDQTSVAPGGTTNNAGQAARDAAATVANNTNNTTATSTSPSGTPTAKGFPEGKRAVTKDEYGTSVSMQKVPAGQKQGNKFYGNVTEQEFVDFKAANPWYDFTDFDPSNKKQVLAFQKAYNEKVRTGYKLREDGKFGEQTATSRLYVDDIKGLTPTEAKFEQSRNMELKSGSPVSKQQAEDQKKIFEMNKGLNGSLLAGLGQLIPVGYALARPYRAEGNLPRMGVAGSVGSTAVKGAVLPRVNMNAERSAAERNTVAVRNMIQNQNAGPGGIAAMMAANSNMDQQMLTIANQEQRANRELAGEEARLGQQASQFNVEQAQRAQMANVQNQLAVNQANLEAGIQEARLKIDEKRYKREEILGALDTAAARIAGIVKDEKSYKAQERLAKAIDNTGSYDRFTIYEQLQKESKRKGSPYYGKTDVELKKIASDTYNEVIGRMGLEGETETERTGGARKYTSRLGQLSKGKKTFNI